MPVNNVSNYYTGAAAYGTGSTNANAAAAAVESAEEQLAALNQKEDGFVKSSTETAGTYKPDLNKIKEMKADNDKNIAAFRQMVEGLVGKQANAASKGQLFDLSAARAEAEEAISEDGYWGVEATATRILDFAKALAGGDPSKIETLRKAVEDGFGAAYKVMGGKDKAPSITQQTYDRVMQGFDDWANEGKTTVADD